MITPQQARNIKKGDRIMVNGSKGWVAGTVISKEKYCGSPMLYIKEDSLKPDYAKGHFISTWLNEDGWNELRSGRNFKLLEEQPSLFETSN